MPTYSEANSQLHQLTLAMYALIPLYTLSPLDINNMVYKHESDSTVNE